MAPPKRQRNHRDSIRERGDGWLYVVVRYYDAEGQQDQKWLPTETRSRLEARARKPEIVAGWLQGEGSRVRLPAVASTTVAEQVAG